MAWVHEQSIVTQNERLSLTKHWDITAEGKSNNSINLERRKPRIKTC